MYSYLKTLSDIAVAKKKLMYMESILGIERTWYKTGDLLRKTIIRLSKEIAQSLTWGNENVYKRIHSHLINLSLSKCSGKIDNVYAIYEGFSAKLDEFTSRLSVLEQSIKEECKLWDGFSTNKDLEKMTIHGLQRLVEKWETRVKILPDWERAMNSFVTEWDLHLKPKLKENDHNCEFLIDSLLKEHM
ncbi:unnamed protein product [Orchesella dallaii]|uniref:Uncharacterized protein n=1 Tax=Orchesella dallaii TaxID=48710 RepID=A0ABP1PW37_9HEXA